PDAIDLRKYKSYEEEIKWAHQHMENFMRRYLRMGVTSVIDVGSSVNFLKQRDSFRNKTYAPSVYMTGPLLTTFEPPIYKGLGDDSPFYLMKSVEDAKTYVQKQLPYKPDFIKIWYIVQGRNTDSAARSNLPMVKAVIEEAHKNNLRVAVHATEEITARLAVEAGADFLVHGIEDKIVDDSFVQLLKNRKTVMSPTMVVAGNYYKVFGQLYKVTEEDFHYAHPAPLNSVIDLKAIPDTQLTGRYKNFIRANMARSNTEDSIRMVNLKKLSDGGVILATGTDAGNIGTQHASSYFDELRAMKQSGLSNWQLLQASTINGAKAVGQEQKTGSIMKGKIADLVLLDKNPVEDIMNLKTIVTVINKGAAHDPVSVHKPAPVELADQQLLAYNAHNLEAFLAPYAEDVQIYDFPGKLDVMGKDNMRKTYVFLNNTPKLYCRLLNRIVQGNIVIDHEEVWGFGDKPFYGIAIYEIEGDKIKRVYFPH
ncbi:MAG TPA: amidohydrolase family protein, partial [Chitinophagaceae bacterium]